MIQRLLRPYLLSSNSKPRYGHCREQMIRLISIEPEWQRFRSTFGGATDVCCVNEKCVVTVHEMRFNRAGIAQWDNA